MWEVLKNDARQIIHPGNPIFTCIDINGKCYGIFAVMKIIRLVWCWANWKMNGVAIV